MGETTGAGGRPTTGEASGRPLLPRIDRPTIDELTVLSEAEALRRRMDQRNLPVLRWLAAAFSLLGIGLWIAAAVSRPGNLRVLGSLIAFLLPALFFLVLRRIDPARSGRPSRLAILDPIARGVARSFRTATLGYLGLQFLFLVFPRVEASGPWLYLFPLVLLAIRLSVTEAAVLHGFYLVCAFVWTILSVPSGAPAGEGNPADQTFIPALILNITAWAGGAFATWRYRRQFLAYWRDLRERARDSARMRDELELARRVQLSMLPHGEIADGWIRVAGTSVPATEVGGDYFDWFRLEGDRVAVVAGDVAGHGLASGLILSGLRSGLILLAPELSSPAAVLEKLQRMVRETATHRMFVTLAVLLLDRARGQAVLASAGHPPILRRDGESGEVEQLPAASLPLGARLRETSRETAVRMAPGDLFVLYTDGVYEAAGPDGEPFGFERLSQIVASSEPGASPREVCDAILSAVRSWSGAGGVGDDATVVAVRVEALGA